MKDGAWRREEVAWEREESEGDVLLVLEARDWGRDRMVIVTVIATKLG